MKTKKFLKIALLVVIAALFIWTFVFLYQKSQPKVTVYETIVPEVTDLEKTTVATGKVEPRDEVLIKPQISGIIAEVYKEAGQSVKQGEVLAKVKVIPELGQLNSAESRVRLAEINAAQAETDFARTQKLYNDKLISAEEYEKGEVSVKQAREELQTPSGKPLLESDLPLSAAHYPGTGDTFTSVITGSLMQGDSLPMALDRATQFILQGIRATFGYEYDNREGILLEKVLHNLDMPIQMASYELI